MIEIPISPGELLDRITILEIKLAQIKTFEKRMHVDDELKRLKDIATTRVPNNPSIETLTQELKSINEALWQIEDAIRLCEKLSDFGPDFVKLARSVYQQNDKRSRVKRQINDFLDAEIVEEKSYEEY